MKLTLEIDLDDLPAVIAALQRIAGQPKAKPVVALFHWVDATRLRIYYKAGDRILALHWQGAEWGGWRLLECADMYGKGLETEIPLSGFLFSPAVGTVGQEARDLVKVAENWLANNGLALDMPSSAANAA